MSRDTDNESTGETKARDAAAKLDETAEKLAGTSNVAPGGTEVGHTERNVEERAQQTAEEEGVTLHRNADGSHSALDESQADDESRADPDE